MAAKLAALGAAAALSTIAGCSRGAPAANAAGPVEVGVVTLQVQSASISQELPGRTVAYRMAEVRPQITGIVQQRMFAEGSEVKAGEQLFQIDSASYRATLRSAEAALQRADARLTAARLLQERYAPLIAANAVSKQEFDEAVATHAAADADVAAARAQVEAARINVVYTQVLAPISGRIGRTLVTEGALVTSEQSSPLALVQQLDPIYVDIAQSSIDLLRLQRQLANGELQKDEQNQAEVTLTLEDGSAYGERGKLQFSEVSVDPGTGAVVLRAIFPNPRRELLPGMFVRTQLSQAVINEALLVPQRAVTRNQRGDALVLVVGADDKVAERQITAPRAIGNDWLVTEGLAAGDRVIVDGLQKVRAGAAVKAVPAAAQTNAAVRASANVAQR